MIRRLLPAIALLMLCLFAAPRSVIAFDLFQGADCAHNPSSAVCKSQAAQNKNTYTDANGKQQQVDPLTGSDGILARITNIVAYAAGAAAVIVIIVSALRFITSGSDISTGSRTDTDVENARRSLAGAVIGLVVIVLARTLIIYVLNKIGGT